MYYNQINVPEVNLYQDWEVLCFLFFYLICFFLDVLFLFLSKGLAHASQNQEVVKALGEPIERGPWYNASLAVAHRRHSVSCTFPVSGPNGTGVLQLKAVRQGQW